MSNLKKEMTGRAGFTTAVDAMINGLEKQDNRDGFRVDMAVFGDVSCPTAFGKRTCIGCAATCMIQEFFDVDFDVNSIPNEHTRAAAVNLSIDRLLRFEVAIEYLRCGYPSKLCDLFRLDAQDYRAVAWKFEGLPELENGCWIDDLHEYKTALHDLKDYWGLSTPGN